MIKSFKTINKDNSFELVEKRSRFIANMYKISSTEEAEQKIKQIKKKYHDAKHNCYAFSVIENNQRITRMNDDGEPSGTAGEPILNVILKNEIDNVLIVVTRYFGGILLGTGGLTRAYSNSSLGVLNNIDFVNLIDGSEQKVEISYDNVSKLRYFLEKNNIKIVNTEYLQNVIFTIEINDEKLEELLNKKNDVNGINIINCVEICRKYIENEGTCQ